MPIQLADNVVLQGGAGITGAPTPTTPDAVATKDYVDSALGARAFKAAVRVATTAAITRSGLQTIDGYALVAGDRVLVKNQADGTLNGIYDAATGAWARSVDSDISSEVPSGTFVYVQQGTSQHDTAWVLTTDPVITLGASVLTFAQFPVAGVPVASAYGTVQDEGTALASRGVLDFVGAGVTATDDAAGSRTLITIPGGGSGGLVIATTLPADPGTPAAGATGQVSDAGHAHSDTHAATYDPADNGMLAVSLPPAFAAGTTIMTAGAIHLIRMKIRRAITVNNITVYVSTAGATLTNCYAGLYSVTSGALLGSTADQSAVWTSTQAKTMALGSAVALAAGSEVYVGLLANGTTAPTLARGSATQAPNIGRTVAAGNLWLAQYGSALTALPNPITLTSMGTANTIAYFVGLS